MPALRFRFTIRAVMIAVLIAAGLLALPGDWAAAILVIAVLIAGPLGAERLFLRGHRRAAALGFWVLGVSWNAIYIALCLEPDVYFLMPLFLGWIFMTPTVGGLGIAWVRLTGRDGAVPARARAMAGISVFALCLLPAFTVCTCWPLRLAFLTARPALETLADQVAARKASSFPVRAGVFRIRGSGIDPATGSVGLMTDPNPSGPTGFVRLGLRNSPIRRDPIVGSHLYIELGWGWSYREED
jgi:hypothetical protein